VWASNQRTFRLAGVLGVLLFCFWIGMGPHRDYRYPLHVDEWFAIGYAQSTLEAGKLRYADPYGLGEISFHPELGFHLLLGFLKTATGLSWMGLYQAAPGVLLALLAFFTYAFGRRLGFGWPAMLLVPLIPTSVRTLGPAFVVPVSAAMLLIPVTLLVLHSLETEARGRSLLILGVLIGGTLFVHPTTEGVATALAVVYLATSLVEEVSRRRYSRVANLLFAIGVRILVPVVVLGVWLPALSREALAQTVSGDTLVASVLGLHTGFVEAFGPVALALALGGLFLFIWQGESGLRAYVLPVFTCFLLGFLLFLYPRYGLGPDVLYERGWSYLGLLLVIMAGCGVAAYFRSVPVLAAALRSRLRRNFGGWLAPALWCGGGLLLLVAMATSLVDNEGRRSYEAYYRLINQANYADLRWIGQHTRAEHTVTTGESSMAWPYPPVGGPGKRVNDASAEPWTSPYGQRMRAMVASDQVDVPWLRHLGVSVLYTCRPTTFDCPELTSPGLFKVRRGVYLVPR
jgi:hypothetical protein